MADCCFNKWKTDLFVRYDLVLVPEKINGYEF